MATRRPVYCSHMETVRQQKFSRKSIAHSTARPKQSKVVQLETDLQAPAADGLLANISSYLWHGIVPVTDS